MKTISTKTYITKKIDRGKGTLSILEKGTPYQSLCYGTGQALSLTKSQTVQNTKIQNRGVCHGEA